MNTPRPRDMTPPAAAREFAVRNPKRPSSASPGATFFAMLAGVALLSAAGCESYPQDDYQEALVVEAYLREGDPLPEIRLSTTGEADQAYAFEDLAVRNAQLSVHLLAETGGALERTYAYTAQSPGVFAPVDGSARVLAGRTYELEARVDGRQDMVRGRTTVPDSIRVVGEVPESLVYQSEDQLEIRVAVESPAARQNVFVFSTIALDTVETNLTPFYRSQFEDSDVTLSELSKTSSGTLNEGNFTRNPDGTYTLSFPWIGISFYGRNQIVTSVIDENLYDLVRSQSVQLGGSTLSPGEIQNVIYRLEGAIGVFGSLASDTLSTSIEPGAFEF